MDSGSDQPFRFFLRKMFLVLATVMLQWKPMRRSDRDGLAIFADPSVLLRRPATKLKSPRRIILKNDELPVFRCCFYLTAHVARLFNA